MPAAYRSVLRRLMPLFIVGVAGWVFATYGLDGKIARDDALYAYAGQCVADGHAPYERAFDVKGPLASAIPALGVIAARHASAPDHRGVQIEFIIISVLCVLAVYLLGQALTDSSLAGTFAALTFLGFEGFIAHAAGARPKTAVVLFTTLALLAIVRKRWAVGGALIAVAALTWQTMALVGLGALAAVLGEAPQKRLRALVSLLAGAGAVVAVVVAWFAAAGALVDLWNAAVASPPLLASRARELPLSWRIWRPVRRCYEGYPATFMAAGFGVLGLAGAFVMSLREWGGPIGAITRSRWSVVFTSFTLLAAFTFIDFQIYDDAYPLLPFAAVGFGFVLERALRGMVSSDGILPGTHRELAAAAVCLAILSPTVVFVKFQPGTGLSEQKQAVTEIKERLGDGRIQAINAPEVLYLGELTNATKHAVVGPRVLAVIDAMEPGGVDAWLRSIEEADVELIVCNTSDCHRMVPEVGKWVEEDFELWREYDRWQVYERRD